jgi:hypothetical protein
MNQPYLTQAQLAADYVCNIATIRRAKADGVDVQNRDAFAAWVKTKAKRPHAWINGVPWEQEEKQAEDFSSDEERELMDQVRHATDYDTARTLKTKIDAIHKLKQIEILEGDYIHKEEVISDITRISAAVAAAHRQCQADLPAMLEGLTAAKAKNKIRDYMLRIDGQLADETNKLYK